MTPDEIEALVKKTLQRTLEPAPPRPVPADEWEILHGTITAQQETIAALRRALTLRDETVEIQRQALATLTTTLEHIRSAWQAAAA